MSAAIKIDMGETALWYASGKWAVHPLVPDTKDPLTDHGYKDASCDPAPITAWWNKWRSANIGVACSASGLILIDFDPLHYTDETRALLADLLDNYPTSTQSTPTDGRHLYYKLPSDIALDNSKGSLPPGIDVKVNGYGVLAPSAVTYRGADATRKGVADGYHGCYQWLPGRNPKDCPPKTLPSKLRELLRPAQPQPRIQTEQTAHLSVLGDGANPAYAKTVIQGALDDLANCPEGKRSKTVYATAARLGELVVQGYLTEADVETQVLEAANRCGILQFDGEAKTRRAIRNGLRKGMSDPKAVPAPPSNELLEGLAMMARENAAHKQGTAHTFTGYSNGNGNGAPGANNEAVSDDGGTSDDTDDVSKTKGNGKRKRKSKGEDDDRKPTQAEILYSLAQNYVDIFTGQDGTAYAFVPVDGRRECYRLKDSNFSGYLTALYRAKCDGAMPGADGRKEAIAALTWDARTIRRDVFVRVGGQDGKVYIDLGTEEWDAVEIDAEGWRIVAKPPVAFRRPASLKPLPLPMRGGTLALLGQYVNVEADDWPLVAAWLIAATNPSGPYPILAFAGEQGTAKSSTIRALKETIDPAAAGLRGQPEDIRDLWVGANNGWLLAYDNVSHLNNDVSDALCRLSTGGGYAKRANYSDDGEFLMDAQRPVAINGIGDIITRPDLMDRSILICPPVITEDKRRNEKEFWANFDADRPKLLGALLDAVSTALRNIAHVHMDTMPRMADFARLAVAAQPAIGGNISFMDAYHANREEAHATVVETSTLGEHLRTLVLVSGTWEGTATKLLNELNALASDSEKRSQSWPKVPNRIKPALQRLAPSLRHIGVVVEYPKRTDKGGTKQIRLVRLNS